MNILKEVAKSFMGADSNMEEWEEKALAQFKSSESEKDLALAEVEETAEIIEKTEILKAPVIEQVIKPRELIEVQPVVLREREQTEVHEVIQPLREKEVLAPVIDTLELPAIEGEVRESNEEFEKEYNELTEKFKSSVRVEDLQRERIVNKPIIQEVIHKKIIEEIQPVIHKETVVPHVVKEKQPIHEKIIEAPTLVQESIDEFEKRDLKGADVELIRKAPIIEEVIKPRELTEVQPVIMREREVTEVHEVVQPIHAREVLPAVVEEKELPMLEAETQRASQELFLKEYEETTEAFKSSVEVEAVKRERIIKKPIIQEIVHKKIIEEIQPVIHKETLVPHVIREVLPIHEKIVEAPKLFREELEEKDLGITYVGRGSLTSDIETLKSL